MSDNNKPALKSSQNKKMYRYIYSGRSMQSVFKTGELLYSQPMLQDITIGDVIIFYDHETTKNVVHRVIKIGHNQVFTRGDNNPTEDYHPVQVEDILGIVRWANQDGTILPVQGGKQGLKQLGRQMKKNKITQFFLQIFFPFYKVLKSSEIVSKIWHPDVSKIRVMTENGYIIKYVHHNRTVATWIPKNKRFTYRHPYDLVLKPPQDSPQ